jgi:dihydrofolate reductase
MSVVIAMIAAVAENGVIGRAGGIPWSIPSDLAFFKRTTMGKPVVMGRKQFETLRRPLKGRTNIVVTRRAEFAPEGVVTTGSLASALAEALTIAERDGGNEVMVIGGGEIYAQAMGEAGRLYISHVALSPQGDTLFPPIDPKAWRAVAEPPVEPDPRDEAAYVIRVYERG